MSSRAFYVCHALHSLARNWLPRSDVCLGDTLAVAMRWQLPHSASVLYSGIMALMALQEFEERAVDDITKLAPIVKSSGAKVH